MLRRFAIAASGLVVVAMSACSPQAATTPNSAPSKVTVFAAASLKESFAELEKSYEAAHPGVDVVINYGPSSGLAQQIIDGAPADVFASAAQSQMTSVVQAGKAQNPTTFASNTLVIAVAPGNPGHINSAADLTRTDLRLALCAVEVPCGQLAESYQKKSGTQLAPKTREVDVKGVLTKVRTGEADAGLVYTTDVLAAGKDGVTMLTLPDAPSTSYPIAAINDAGKNFVAYVTSAEGKRVLEVHGFR